MEKNKKPNSHKAIAIDTDKDRHYMEEERDQLHT